MVHNGDLFISPSSSLVCHVYMFYAAVLEEVHTFTSPEWLSLSKILCLHQNTIAFTKLRWSGITRRCVRDASPMAYNGCCQQQIMDWQQNSCWFSNRVKTREIDTKIVTKSSSPSFEICKLVEISSMISISWFDSHVLTISFWSLNPNMDEEQTHVLLLEFMKNKHKTGQANEVWVMVNTCLLVGFKVHQHRLSLLLFFVRENYLHPQSILPRYCILFLKNDILTMIAFEVKYCMDLSKTISSMIAFKAYYMHVSTHWRI